MHAGLLIPSERPPTDIDIKRALLVLDQIQLPDPADRELIPPEHYMTVSTQFATGYPAPMAVNQGPVLPLGKIARYDELFEQAVSACREAEKQAALVIRPTPTFQVAGTFALGGAPTPAGWPSSLFTYAVCKLVSTSPDALISGLDGVPGPDQLRAADTTNLAPGGKMLVMTIQGQGPIGTLQDPSIPEDLAAIYTNVAAARLGSAVKSCGICHVNDLHPVSMDPGINALLSMFQRKSAIAFQNAMAAENDPDAIRLALRVERILFEQLLPDETLGAMSIDQVLKLRTKAWGKVGELRVQFFRVLREMASEVKGDREFDDRVLKEIEAYNTANQAFVDDLKQFGFKAGGFVIGGTTSVSDTVKKLCEQLLGVGSWEVALLLGAGAAVKELGPDAISLWTKLRERQTGAGRLLVRPYVGIAS